MQNDKFFWGKGIWIFQMANAENGNVDAQIAKAKDAGISYVIIKAVDGTNWFYPGFTKEFVQKWHNAGIKVYAWGYHYGGNQIDEELRLAITTIDPEKVNADGYVFDVEKEFFSHSDWAAHLTVSLRAEVVRQQNELKRRPLLALSTFGDPEIQSKEPYRQLLNQTDVYMPQTYYGDWIGAANTDAIAAVDKYGYSEWLDMKNQLQGDMRPIIPTIPSISTNGFNLTAEINTKVMEYLKGYGGVNFWVWNQNMTQEIWDSIKNFNGLEFVGTNYPASPTPPSEPVQVATDPIQVLQTQLNSLNEQTSQLNAQVKLLTDQNNQLTADNAALQNASDLVNSKNIVLAKQQDLDGQTIVQLNQQINIDKQLLADKDIRIKQLSTLLTQYQSQQNTFSYFLNMLNNKIRQFLSKK